METDQKITIKSGRASAPGSRHRAKKNQMEDGLIRNIDRKLIDGEKTVALRKMPRKRLIAMMNQAKLAMEAFHNKQAIQRYNALKKYFEENY